MRSLAVRACGITDRSTFTGRPRGLCEPAGSEEIFDQAFHIFWKNPRILERMMRMILPEFRAEGQSEDKNDTSRRIAEALSQPQTAEPGRRRRRGHRSGSSSTL